MARRQDGQTDSKSGRGRLEPRLRTNPRRTLGRASFSGTAGNRCDRFCRTRIQRADDTDIDVVRIALEELSHVRDAAGGPWINGDSKSIEDRTQHVLVLVHGR